MTVAPDSVRSTNKWANAVVMDVRKVADALLATTIKSSPALAPTAVVAEFVAQIDAVAESRRFNDLPASMAGQFDASRIVQETIPPVYATARDLGLPIVFVHASGGAEPTQDEAHGSSDGMAGAHAAVAAGGGCLVLIGAALALQRSRRQVRRDLQPASAQHSTAADVGVLPARVLMAYPVQPSAKQVFCPATGQVLHALPVHPNGQASTSRVEDPYSFPSAFAVATPVAENAVSTEPRHRPGRAEQQQQQQVVVVPTAEQSATV